MAMLRMESLPLVGRVDFSLLLHRSSIDADRGGLEPRRLLERPPGGDSLWARHLDCTSANLASTCKMGRHCKRVIYKRRFPGSARRMRLDSASTRAHANGKPPTTPCRSGQRSRHKLAHPRWYTAENTLTTLSHAHSTIRDRIDVPLPRILPAPSFAPLKSAFVEPYIVTRVL